MRIVMFVYNDVSRDARVLREASSLAAAGHEVTVMGRPRDLAARGSDRESRDGVTVIRVPIPHRWRLGWTLFRRPWRMGPWVRGRLGRGIRRGPRGLPSLGAGLAVGLTALAWSILGAPLHLMGRRLLWTEGGLIEWLVLWRFAILGWARDAAAAAPAADVWHGHDLTGLPGALAALRARGGSAVFDSHEIFLESGANADRPRVVRWLFARLERRWSRSASALVTVNDALAQELGQRLAPRRTVVVHNCPPRWTPPDPPPDLIRAATGIPPEAAILLYHGGFSAHRGLEELAAAILEPGLEHAHAVYLGYGKRHDELRRLATDPRYGGRVHVLDAVPPDELLPWVASADVGVMVNQPTTRNEWVSTPNKLFECLAAGTPVVSSDFPGRCRIILDDPDGPLGAVCDPTDPAAIAAAVRSLIDQPPAARADLRARCLRAAHLRWNWETEVARLLALYGELAGATAP
jgi:glycosyltransferase involved in cell wall biosynthesis